MSIINVYRCMMAPRMILVFFNILFFKYFSYNFFIKLNFCRCIIIHKQKMNTCFNVYEKILIIFINKYMLKYLFSFTNESKNLKSEIEYLNSEKEEIEHKYRKCLEEINRLKTEHKSDDSCDEYQSSFTKLLVAKKKNLKKNNCIFKNIHKDIITKNFKLKDTPKDTSKPKLIINDSILHVSLANLRRAVEYSDPTSPT